MTQDSWDQLAAVLPEKNELLVSFRFFAKTVAAPYTYSTRVKLCCEQLTKHVRLLSHIGARTMALYQTVSELTRNTLMTLMRECFRCFDVCFNHLYSKFSTQKNVGEKDYKWGVCNSILKYLCSLIHSFESYGQQDESLYPFQDQIFSIFEESLTKFFVSARALQKSKQTKLNVVSNQPDITESNNYVDMIHNMKKVGHNKIGGRYCLAFARLAFIFEANETNCKIYMNILKTFSEPIFTNLRQNGLKTSSTLYKRAQKFNTKKQIMSVVTSTLRSSSNVVPENFTEIAKTVEALPESKKRKRERTDEVLTVPVRPKELG